MLSVLFGSFYGHIGKVNKYPYRGKNQCRLCYWPYFIVKLGRQINNPIEGNANVVNAIQLILWSYWDAK